MWCARSPSMTRLLRVVAGDRAPCGLRSHHRPCSSARDRDGGPPGEDAAASGARKSAHHEKSAWRVWEGPSPGGRSASVQAPPRRWKPRRQCRATRGAQRSWEVRKRHSRHLWWRPTGRVRHPGPASMAQLLERRIAQRLGRDSERFQSNAKKCDDCHKAIGHPRCEATHCACPHRAIVR